MSSAKTEIPAWFGASLILGIVSRAIVGGVENGLQWLVTEIQRLGETIRGAVLQAGLAVEHDLAGVGNALLGVQYSFRAMFIDAGLSGGIAAPISVAVLTVLSVGFVAAVLGVLWFIIRLVIPP